MQKSLVAHILQNLLLSKKKIFTIKSVPKKKTKQMEYLV